MTAQTIFMLLLFVTNGAGQKNYTHTHKKKTFTEPKEAWHRTRNCVDLTCKTLDV